MREENRKQQENKKQQENRKQPRNKKQQENNKWQEKKPQNKRQAENSGKPANGKRPEEKSAVPCKVYKKCGGCRFLDVSYEEHLKHKEKQVKELCGKFGEIGRAHV